jgi:hypothetical protein
MEVFEYMKDLAEQAAEGVPAFLLVKLDEGVVLVSGTGKFGPELRKLAAALRCGGEPVAIFGLIGNPKCRTQPSVRKVYRNDVWVPDFLKSALALMEEIEETFPENIEN